MAIRTSQYYYLRITRVLRAYYACVSRAYKLVKFHNIMKLQIRILKGFLEIRMRIYVRKYVRIRTYCVL